MCKTSLELAVWDCFARQQGVALRDLIGGTVSEIPVGASLGMNPLDSHAGVGRPARRRGLQADQAEGRAGLGPRAARPGARRSIPDIELTVDANSAYTLDDIDTLRRFDDYGLKYIEQPLHWDDLVDHAALAPQLRTALCLDESLTSPARVRAALDLRRLHRWSTSRSAGSAGWPPRCRSTSCASSVACRCGAAGCWRPAIGRAHNIHIATLPGFTYPGDTASASRARTPATSSTQPLEATDGMMPVPLDGPGIGVTLDRAFLAEVTESVETIRR